MKHKSPFPVKLDDINESVNSFFDFLKNSYQEQREKLSEGTSFLKEGLSDAIDKTKSYVNLVAYPINNFLKDFTKIEEEFKQESLNEQEYTVCLDGKIVSGDEALSLPMEENY
jgi:hypothetical protein